MTDISSDTDSSGGWTLINNEDIEKIETDIRTCAGEGHEEDVLVREEAQQPEKVGPAISELEKIQQEELVKETLLSAEVAGKVVAGEGEVLSSGSDVSDTGTVESSGKESLGMWEGPEEESVESGSALLDLGTSAIRQHTFSTTETLFPMVPPAGESSSSESETRGQLVSPATRRRRGKKAGAHGPGGGQGATPEQQGKQAPEQQEVEEQQEEGPCMATPIQNYITTSNFNLWILLAVTIAICVGLGHVYTTDSTVQFQHRQKVVDRTRVKDLIDMGGDPLRWHQKEREAIIVNKEVTRAIRVEPKELCGMTPPTADNVERKPKGNIQLQSEQQKEAFRLKRTVKESSKSGLSMHRKNWQLRRLLDCEEKSVSTLQEELRNLRGQIRNLEWQRVGPDSALTQEHRHERSFLGLREVLMAEAQVLRGELDREQRVTGLLKEQLRQLGGCVPGAKGTGSSETEELYGCLAELEKRLSFERRRSDLWHRLYVEDMHRMVGLGNRLGMKASRESEVGKARDTFDATKNSSRELMHHQKEHTKKARNAVGQHAENLPDSVMTILRSLKEMVKNLLGKESFQPDRNTLIAGVKVYSEQAVDEETTKGYSNVFDCAHQEFISLFNKHRSPIHVDEFSQLILNYLQQEVGHFQHWEPLQRYVNSFFHNDIFIHDQMLFTDFVSEVQDFLTDMVEYKCLKEHVFEDLDKYVYMHFFGETYSHWYGHSGCSEQPILKGKEERISEYHKSVAQSQTHPHLQKDRKWTRPEYIGGRHLENVKIELDTILLHAE